LQSRLKVALVGNPNSGKSSLFNALTGLNQKVGNFPGTTIDKKTGNCSDNYGHSAKIIDLPGTYSLYPKSTDEDITFEYLFDKHKKDHPGLVVVVADASNLKRHLLLFTQIADLKIPVILALNMMDVAEKKGIKIDVPQLNKRLGIPVVKINARRGEGIEDLKKLIFQQEHLSSGGFLNTGLIALELTEQLKTSLGLSSYYTALQIAHHSGRLSAYQEKALIIAEILKKNNFNSKRLQSQETILRYKVIDEILSKTVQKTEPGGNTLTHRIDEVLTHRIWGFLIFLLILFLIFQAIFTFSKLPMEWIEFSFIKFGQFFKETLPGGILNDLLVNGILAGLSGVVVFLPQIVILFAFIALLEDTGYMARVSFLMDKMMRSVGLNGKSIVPLISGIACAVPAIMATRNIENSKERLITIMVTPLMSCSARLPVYTLLISMIAPDTYVLGVFNLQGLLLMLMYLIGFVAAIAAAWVFKKILKRREKDYFIMELPEYRTPRWKNIGFTLVEKAKTFLFEAGKVIVAVSIVLWGLASFGPGDSFADIERKYNARETVHSPEVENRIQSEKLAASYAGILGRFIEPAIKPLGFDWKIGIALVSSLAAREVFVGTMATIYSIGNSDDEKSIREKMMSDRHPDGTPVYTPAVAFSLMLFYAFALQCMSTVAVVYRETKGWKWPLVQFAYMSIMAWVASFIVYNLLK
jgi:ferrous iron transport protein B